MIAFKESLQGLAQFPELVEKVKVVIGISAGRVFLKYILRIEISGPKMPKLILIDLPGLKPSVSYKSVIAARARTYT